MAELRRILLEPKSLLLLVMFAVINLALFSGQQEERELSRQQLAAWGISDRSAETEAEQEAYYLNTEYPAYLSYVQKQSQTQSVLQKLSKDESLFVTRNLEKTVQDYQALGNLELTAGDHRALDAVLDCSLTDILLLFAPILLILRLVAEADTAVGALIRTTKRGRLPLCAWRIAAAALFSLTDVLLLYGGNFCYAVSQYGSPGFSRALQSVPAFQLCAQPLTIGGFLLCTVLLKTLALTVLSLLAWVILSRFHPLPGWTLTGLLFAAMFLCHRLIMPTSPFNHLRFLNPFAALQADAFFTNYCNLNIFAYPVGFLRCMLTALAAMLILLIAGCLLLIGSQYPQKHGMGMVRLFDRIAKRVNRRMPRHTVFGFEGWKLLFAQRACVFVLAMLGGVFWLWNDIHISVPSSNQIEQIYRRYEGEVTQEKRDSVSEQVQRCITAVENAQNALDSAIAEGRDELSIGNLRKTLFDAEEALSLWRQVDDRLTELAEYTARTGLDAWFIRQESYQLLFYGNAIQRRCAAVLLLYLIFALAGVFAFDRRYDTAALLRSTKNGRGRMRLCQWIWMFLLTVPAALLLHGAYILHIARDITFSMPEAPAQSIPLLQFLPFPVTVRTALIGYLVIRCLAAMLLTAGIAGISRLNRQHGNARTLSLAAFLLPSALYESGMPLPAFLDFVNNLTVTV